jgi:hypothetical protein
VWQAQLWLTAKEWCAAPVQNSRIYKAVRSARDQCPGATCSITYLQCVTIYRGGLVSQAGRKTLVLEKSLSQPDRIVGELLQPGGYLMLKKMGLEDCTREIDAQEVYGYALFKGDSAFNIHYPTEGYDKDVSGRSFHHGRYVTSPGSLHSRW